MRIKTSELTGAPLNWAVAKCEEACVGDGYYTGIVLRDGEVKYTPSTDWSQGGPIIEHNAIHLTPDEYLGVWSAYMTNEGEPYESTGPTPLIAAMRCFVASKLGDEVEIPKELLT
jgi:hypothetical protein